MALSQLRSLHRAEARSPRYYSKAVVKFDVADLLSDSAFRRVDSRLTCAPIKCGGLLRPSALQDFVTQHKLLVPAERRKSVVVRTDAPHATDTVPRRAEECAQAHG